MLGSGIAKSSVLEMFRFSGLNRISRYRTRCKLLVLCYHGVLSSSHKGEFGYGNTVSTEEFRLHLEFLVRHFRPVTTDEVLAARQGGRPLPDNAVLITFDDGYSNNLYNAAGVLSQLGVPCVFHVSTGYIGTSRMLWLDELIGRVRSWEKETIPLPGGGSRSLPASAAERRVTAWEIKEQCKRLPAEIVELYLGELRQYTAPPLLNDELHRFMTWEEVRELHKNGFEIGSHTLEHPILTRIPADRLRRELAHSKEIIERELGVPCRCIAYPNGGHADVSADVFDVARSCGYLLGFTVAEQMSAPGEDLLGISRLCIQGHLPMSVFHYRAGGAEHLL